MDDKHDPCNKHGYDPKSGIASPSEEEMEAIKKKQAEEKVSNVTKSNRKYRAKQKALNNPEADPYRTPKPKQAMTAKKKKPKDVSSRLAKSAPAKARSNDATDRLNELLKTASKSKTPVTREVIEEFGEIENRNTIKEVLRMSFKETSKQSKQAFKQNQRTQKALNNVAVAALQALGGSNRRVQFNLDQDSNTDGDSDGETDTDKSEDDCDGDDGNGNGDIDTDYEGDSAYKHGEGSEEDSEEDDSPTEQNASDDLLPKPSKHAVDTPKQNKHQVCPFLKKVRLFLFSVT